MHLLLASLLFAALPAGGPAPVEERGELLGVCTGPQGPLAFWARAAGAPVTPSRTHWELQLRVLDLQGALPGLRTVTEAPPDLGFIPATPGLSWRQLHDGTQVLWSPGLSVVTAPGPRPTGLTAATLERNGAACPGVTWAPPRVGVPGPRALLVLPGQLLAVAVGSGGSVATLPLLETSPPPSRRPRRRHAPPPIPGPVGTAVTARLAPVPGGWELVLQPSGTRATLHVEAQAQEGSRVVSRVAGLLALDGGTAELAGVVVEEEAPEP